MTDLSRLTLSELAAALAPRDYYTPEQAAQAFERVGFSDAGQG